MKADELRGHVTHQRGHAFKPGNPNLKGRNYDAGLDAVVNYYQLAKSDRVDVSNQLRTMGRLTLWHPTSRKETIPFNPASEYSIKPNVLRLGGV